MSVGVKKNKAKTAQAEGEAKLKPEIVESNLLSDQQSSATQTGEATAASAELQQVQELLFGAQSRDFERKISKLEQLFQSSITDLRAAMDNNMASLLEKVQQFSEQLDDKVAAEGRERLQQFDELQQSIKDTHQHIDNLQLESGQSQADLENRFFAQAEHLNQEFNTRNEEILKKLEQVECSLKDEKTDRSMLARLLKTMAEQIEADN